MRWGKTPGVGWPRAVTRPGLPQIRTCAINAYGSSSNKFAMPRARPTVAIHGCYVEMLMELGVSGICLSHGFIARQRLSSTGFDRMRSPASSVLCAAPNPCRPSRRTSFPSLGGTTGAFLFRSCDAEHDVAGQRLIARYPLPGNYRGNGRASQVPGEPPVCMPRSPTPAGSRIPSHTAPRCSLPRSERRRLPQ